MLIYIIILFYKTRPSLHIGLGMFCSVVDSFVSLVSELNKIRY